MELKKANCRFRVTEIGSYFDVIQNSINMIQNAFLFVVSNNNNKFLECFKIIGDLDHLP